MSCMPVPCRRGFPSSEYRSVQTVLRSVDFGATWQDTGKRAQMSRDCELTINPTDSCETYVATSSNPPTNQAVPSLRADVYTILNRL